MDTVSEPETPATTDSPPPVSRPPSFRRALAHRPFFLLWVSQLVSQSGDFIFEVALLWLVLETTGSVFAVGLVVTATLLPAVALGPFLGVYVDRWPRRTLLLATNLAEGVLVAALAGLVLDHAAGFGVILGIAGGLGAGSQVVRITSNALVPRTVAADDLGPANGLLSFSGSFNQIVGLSVGGLVVALVGVDLPIAYDAVSFFVAAALLVLLPRAIGDPERPKDGARRRFSAELAEGFDFVRRQRFLVEVIVLGIVVNFFANAVSALFAPYADLVLHGGPTTYGLLGATVAGGALVGSFVAGKLDSRHHAGRYLFGGGVGIGVVIAALGLTGTPSVALTETLALGLLLSITNIPLLTVVQAKVPVRLTGRVMAVLFSLIVAAGPLGTFFAGSFAAASSVSTVFLVGGIAVTVSISVGALFMADLRNVQY